MPVLSRLIAKVPMPTQTRLNLQRAWIDNAYAKDIAAARKANDKDRVETLERDHQFEIGMHDEEEDAYLTKTLVTTARKLRVQVPRIYEEGSTKSEHWREGHYTGKWHLTARGVSALREEVRKELKARRESRSHWVVWLSAFTGLVGAITGLVALLMKKVP